MAAPVISVQGLVKRYGDVTAIDGVSFEVQRGEVFVVYGARGSGKTSVIEILGCVVPPTAGSATVLGFSVSDSSVSEQVRRRVSMPARVLGSVERTSVVETLRSFGGVDVSEAASNLLDRSSKVEKPRARLGNPLRLLRHAGSARGTAVEDSELILLDDPALGLDVEVRTVVWKAVEGLRARGKTVVLATSSASEAEHLADRVAVLSGGRLQALDTPGGLLAKYGGAKAVVFKEGGDSAFGTLRRFFDAVSMEGQDVVLPFERFRDLQVAFTALVERGLESEVSFRVPSVQGVLQRLTTGEGTLPGRPP